MTAGAAQCQRRIAAAVEKQQRLFLALKRNFDRFGKTRRDESSARRAFAPHVDSFDCGQVLSAEALGQTSVVDSVRDAR